MLLVGDKPKCLKKNLLSRNWRLCVHTWLAWDWTWVSEATDLDSVELLSQHAPGEAKRDTRWCRP